MEVSFGIIPVLVHLLNINGFCRGLTTCTLVEWFLRLCDFLVLQDPVVKHSVHTLVFRSLKRTHDMFLAHEGQPIPEDDLA